MMNPEYCQACIERDNAFSKWAEDGKIWRRQLDHNVPANSVAGALANENMRNSHAAYIAAKEKADSFKREMLDIGEASVLESLCQAQTA